MKSKIDFQAEALSSLFQIQKEAGQEIERRKFECGNFLSDFIFLVRKEYEDLGRKKAVAFFCRATGIPDSKSEAIIDSWSEIFDWSTRGGP